MFAGDVLGFTKGGSIPSCAMSLYTSELLLERKNIVVLVRVNKFRGSQRNMVLEDVCLFDQI